MARSGLNFCSINARIRGLFFAWLFASSASAVFSEDTPKIYLIAEFFARSESVSIGTVYNEMIGEFDSGTQSNLFQWYEVGILFEHWGLGYVARKDFSLQYSEDTSELIGIVINGGELDVDREYDIWLEAQAFQASGLRLSWRPELRWPLDMEWGLSALYADYLLDGSIEGVATALASSEYDYSMAVDYHYAEDYLFERDDVDAPTGYGLTLDFSLAAEWADAWRWHLQARDLLGAIYWPESPQTFATAYSDRVTITESGYAEWDPVVSGTETFDDYLQRLSPRVNSELYRMFNEVQYGVGLQYWQDDWLTRFGVGYDLGNTQLFGWYWRENSAIELSVRWPDASVSIGADHLNPNELQSLHVGVSVNY